MNEINCENVLMAKMAELDAERPDLSVEQVNLHVMSCENCRQEIGLMLDADSLMKRQVRREQDADLWPAVQKRIRPAMASQIGWKPFALLGALLVGYKMLEIFFDRAPGLAFNLIPLVFVVALFVLIKENPFRINTELILER